MSVSLAAVTDTEGSQASIPALTSAFHCVFHTWLGSLPAETATMEYTAGIHW